MIRKVIHSKVGSDGVLHLDVPMGPDGANREVRGSVMPCSVAITKLLFGRALCGR